MKRGPRSSSWTRHDVDVMDRPVCNLVLQLVNSILDAIFNSYFINCERVSTYSFIQSIK